MKKQDIFAAAKKKIIWMSLGIVVGTLLIFSIMTECIYYKVVFETTDQQLLTHKNMIINNAHIQYEGENIKEVILPAPLIKSLINYVWQGGTLLKDSPQPYEGTTKYPVFPQDTDEKTVYLLEDNGQYYRGIQFMFKGCKVQLLVSVNSQMASLASLRKSLLGAFAVLILIALLMAFYLANTALKPLNHAYDKMSHFIQDASHEMRTPLAVVKGKLELLVRRGNEPIEEHYEELGMIMSEINGLEKMNKDLLMLSKEDMPCTLEVKEVNASAFLGEIADLYEEVASMSDIDFIREINVGDTLVKWDTTRVRRCLCILLDNAIKYTSAAGSVQITAQKQDKYIQCVIKDTGYGMKAEELKYIFDRFYRSSEVRSKQIEGSGIGLSLLQSLAKTLNIKICVQSTYGKGSSFTLRIPISMQ